jgi:hypothetical protein
MRQIPNLFLAIITLSFWSPSIWATYNFEGEDDGESFVLRTNSSNNGTYLNRQHEELKIMSGDYSSLINRDSPIDEAPPAA